MREITLRYPGVCRVCGAALPRRVRAMHDPDTRTVRCIACAAVPADPARTPTEPAPTEPAPTEPAPAPTDVAPAPTEPAPAHQPARDELPHEPAVPASGEPRAVPEYGRAGASARREYERRRQARRARARDRFGKLGVAWVAVSAEPQGTRAWREGAEGEERVAKRLEQLLDSTRIRFLHDLAVPGHRTNIDHLAVGPGGVTVIDAKNLKGKLRVETRGGLLAKRTTRLLVAGRDSTKLVDGLERQITVVRAALTAAGHDTVPVRGALCVVRSDGLPLFGTLRVREVIIAGPRRVAKLISRNGPIGSPMVDEIWRALAVRFPSA